MLTTPSPAVCSAAAVCRPLCPTSLSCLQPNRFCLSQLSPDSCLFVIISALGLRPVPTTNRQPSLMSQARENYTDKHSAELMSQPTVLPTAKVAMMSTAAEALTSRLLDTALQQTANHDDDISTDGHMSNTSTNGEK
ncbi:unnamed protein product [Gadus morhua 'NCC']